MVDITCPNCGAHLEIADAVAEGDVPCPNCGEFFDGREARGLPNESKTPSPRTRAFRRFQNKKGWREAMSESTTITPAKLVLAIGLLLVVAGRGCDSIARRGMLRAQARVEHIQATFDATWEPKIDDVKQVIASTREMQPRREAERQLSQLQAQRDAAARGGYNKKLADARSEARLAGSSATMRAYWYEWVFVIGSLLLVTGLLWTAATGTWPERIICLAMLVVITFSVYILGAAWLSSAATTVQGVR